MALQGLKKALAASLSAILLASSIVTAPVTVLAGDTPGVLPANEGDVGVYTDGKTTAKEIGDPEYQPASLAATKQSLAPGVSFTANSMHRAIFEQDKQNGGTDYYLDRILGVKGNIGSSILQTRGRTLYMRDPNSNNFSKLGFAGNAYAGGGVSMGNFYEVTIDGQTVREKSADRFNAPSHFKGTYTVGSTGVEVQQRKFITYDNVAVTYLTFTNSGGTPVELALNTQSPVAKTPTVDEHGEETPDELEGVFNVKNNSNNGLPQTTWAESTVKITMPGATQQDGRLTKAISVPAGGSAEAAVVGVLYTDDLPNSVVEYERFKTLGNDEGFRDAVTAYNERYADDIPYINLPDPAIEKAIVYRWWGELYNSIDANQSGNVYQFPTTVEGSHLYQNAIVLTQPMHLQDTKWIRNPYLAYGQLLNVGELSGSSAFLDSSGHGSWNNHYSQYLGTAGKEAYYVHGGGAQLAEKFAYYFEHDGQGQLEHYDGDGDLLIAYTAPYMPGNDYDAISFAYPKTGGTAGSSNIARPESAYVWGSFQAAAELYALAGAGSAKVNAVQKKADDIQEAVLENLWNDEMKAFLSKTTRGAKTKGANSSNDGKNPLTSDTFIPSKESNHFNPFAEGLVPVADAENYVDAFRFFTYGDNIPIYPFYTANQYDRNRYARTNSGSNNFSNINFTVQYRAVRQALRNYDSTQKYIDNEYAAQLLKWMAWSIYPDKDSQNPKQAILSAPVQAEFYSNFNNTTFNSTRNNPYHVMLGNMNYIFIEDMGGIIPRADALIELDPIDLGYDYFMVNNLRYHNQDITIVWDKDGSHYNLGTGYMLYINGKLAATADRIGSFTYDPATKTATAVDDGLNVTANGAPTVNMPDAVGTPIEDTRVVEYLKKAGLDLTEAAENLAASASFTAAYTQEGARPATWRNFHTPGRTGEMNYDPGSVKETEKPVALAALNDGVTVDQPYWGDYGNPENNGWVEIDLGSEKPFNNVKLYFMSDRQAAGYSEPLSYRIQALKDGKWENISGQVRLPAIPSQKFNEAMFETQTASKLRIAYTNKPGKYTAISEIQVYNTSREMPESQNQAPVLTTSVKTGTAGQMSATLTGTVKDDGLPDEGELTYGWETVSAPEGAKVVILSPNALQTNIFTDKAGDYAIKFWANDGEKSSERIVRFSLQEKSTQVDVGLTATITTTGTCNWENHEMVKNPSNPERSNDQPAWGTWGLNKNGSSEARAAWLQYAFKRTEKINSASIYWYDDGGGTRIPKADTYAIETSSDGQNWTAVELSEDTPYANGLKTGAYNHFNFAPVEANYLRVRIWGFQSGGDGTGIQRLRVYSDTDATAITDEVHLRVKQGDIPTLPDELLATFADGTRGFVDISWAPVTEEMVSQAGGTQTVAGVNERFGLFTEAKLYVRQADTVVGISSIAADSQSVRVNTQPILPKAPLVHYNDGAYDNQVHTATWAYNPEWVLQAGTYEFEGSIAFPEHVAHTDAKAKFTLFVVDMRELEALVAEYSKLTNTDNAYTTESFNAFEAALLSAKAVVTNVDATQPEIDAAFDELSAAILGLTKHPSAAGEKELLAALYNGVQSLNNDSSFYDSTSWDAFEQARNAAGVLLADETATAEDLIAAKQALEAALAALAPAAEAPFTENSLLNALVTESAALTSEPAYTQGSRDALQSAIDAATSLPAEADQAAINAAATAIVEAINALALEDEETPAPINKSVLQAQSTAAGALSAEPYTEDSWAVFAAAKADADAILQQEDATQVAINEKLAALNNAFNTLALKTVEVPVDKSALQAAYDSYKDLSNDEGIYYASGWDAFQQALATAKAVLDNTEADQEMVRQALETLLETTSSLKATANKTELAALVDELDDLDRTKYENAAATWEEFDAALAGAQDILAADATQSEVDAALARLALAKTRLLPAVAIEAVKLDTTVKNLDVGARSQLIATVLPSGAHSGVTWSSSDPSIVSVDSIGMLEAHKSGTATIVATSNANPSLTAACTVTVRQPVTGIEISTKLVEMTEGETTQLTAKVQPSDAAETGIVWSTSDAAIATVDANGKVSALRNGIATITATTVEGNFTGRCEVRVKQKPSDPPVTPKPPVTKPSPGEADPETQKPGAPEEAEVTSVKFPQANVVLVRGKSVTLAATAYRSDGKRDAVTYKSSKTSVAVVNKNGKITGKKAGNATITATASNGKKATLKVRVLNKAPKTGGKVTKVSARVPKTMTVGKTRAIAPKYSPSTAVNVKITYRSSRSSVLAVDKYGTLTAKKPGNATLTIKAGGKTAKYTVTVKGTAPTKITLNKTKATLKVGKSLRLKVSFAPANADKTVTWRSSNPKVATVNEKGVVKALKKGTAKITVTSKTGGKKVVCVVKIS